MFHAASASLRDYFEAIFAPAYLVGASVRTWREYRYTLNAWDKFSSRPLLAAASSFDLAAFKAAASAAGLAAATINKHLRHLCHLFTKAGPIGPGNRDGLGLLPTSPWTKPLREREVVIRTVSDGDLAAFYAAAEVARLPLIGGVSAAAWWRALIVLALTAVLRRGALLALRWADVDLAGRWLTVDGTGDKCGRVRRKPLHVAAQQHLFRIRHDGERVFAWPHGETTWYRQWRAIGSSAGVSFGLHDLKRSGLTRLASSVDSFTLQRLGDHASVRTTQRYYVSIGDDRLAAAVDSLYLPGGLGMEAYEGQTGIGIG